MSKKLKIRSRGVESAVDSIEDGLASAVEGVKKDKYSDIGAGVMVPTKDVIRGLQRLHEAKMPLFERIVQFMSIINTVILIIIVVKLV